MKTKKEIENRIKMLTKLMNEEKELLEKNQFENYEDWNYHNDVYYGYKRKIKVLNWVLL